METGNRIWPNISGRSKSLCGYLHIRLEDSANEKGIKRVEFIICKIASAHYSFQYASPQMKNEQRATPVAKEMATGTRFSL